MDTPSEGPLRATATATAAAAAMVTGGGVGEVSVSVSECCLMRGGFLPQWERKNCLRFGAALIFFYSIFEFLLRWSKNEETGRFFFSLRIDACVVLCN